jgi:glycolate oxidase FAD binding subunit
MARGWLPAVLGELSPSAAVLYPTLGLAFASGEPTSAASLVAGLHDARVAVIAVGGSLVLCEAPVAVRRAFDPWGAPPPAIDLMRSLKERFDPDRRLSPGRFVGGI